MPCINGLYHKKFEVMYNILDLNSKYLAELREIAQSIGIERAGIMKKPDLIFKILNLQPIRVLSPASGKN